MHGSQAETSGGLKPLGEVGAGAEGSDRMHMHPAIQNGLFFLSSLLGLTPSGLCTGYFPPPGQTFHPSFV